MPHKSDSDAKTASAREYVVGNGQAVSVEGYSAQPGAYASFYVEPTRPLTRATTSGCSDVTTSTAASNGSATHDELLMSKLALDGAVPLPLRSSASTSFPQVVSDAGLATNGLPDKAKAQHVDSSRERTIKYTRVSENDAKSIVYVEGKLPAQPGAYASYYVEPTQPLNRVTTSGCSDVTTSTAASNGSVMHDELLMSKLALDGSVPLPLRSSASTSFPSVVSDMGLATNGLLDKAKAQHVDSNREHKMQYTTVSETDVKPIDYVEGELPAQPGDYPSYFVEPTQPLTRVTTSGCSNLSNFTAASNGSVMQDELLMSKLALDGPVPHSLRDSASSVFRSDLPSTGDRVGAPNQPQTQSLLNDLDLRAALCPPSSVAQRSQTCEELFSSKLMQDALVPGNLRRDTSVELSTPRRSFLAARQEVTLDQDSRESYTKALAYTEYSDKFDERGESLDFYELPHSDLFSSPTSTLEPATTTSSFTVAVGLAVDGSTDTPSHLEELLPIPEFLRRNQSRDFVSSPEVRRNQTWAAGSSVDVRNAAATDGRIEALKLTSTQSGGVPGAYRRQNRFSTRGQLPRGALIDAEEEIEEQQLRSQEFCSLSNGGDTEATHLVVAMPVDDDFEDELPSALEIDPDAKPNFKLHSRRRHGHRFFLLVAFTLIFLIAGITFICIILNKQKEALDGGLTQNITAIQAAIELVVGSDETRNPSSPYGRAMQWILTNDPFQLVLDDVNLIQRYIAAYFYYAVTVDGLMTSCNPPDNPWNQTHECAFKDYGVERVASSWLSSASECRWAGLKCNSHGQVISISLSGANLSGTFPDGIVHFPFLQQIQLAKNKLRGPLPSVLSQMKHLTFIQLYYNDFTGFIPENYWDLYRLKELNFGGNYIHGSIPSAVGTLVDLKALRVFENQVTGVIPSEIGNLNSISFFIVNRNKLRGTLPKNMSEWRYVQQLYLHNNHFSGSIPSFFGQFASLTDLIMRVNSLNGTIPEELFQLKKLNNLDLSSNDLSGTLSSSVGNFTYSLGSLILNGNNKLSGTIPSTIGQLTFISKIYLEGTNFMGTIPDTLCQIKGGPVLTELQADCTKNSSGLAQLECPPSCCTICCDAAGLSCRPT